MRLVTLVFKNSTSKYEKLLAVFQKSVEKHSTPLEVRRIEAQDCEISGAPRFRESWYVQNARKAKHQCQIVADAQDGELLGLVDCDLMMLRTLSGIEQLMNGYDMAITTKPPNSSYKFNSGVVFVRVNELTRAWYRDWAEAAVILLQDWSLYEKYQGVYGGIHQSAFGYVQEHSCLSLRLLELPCSEWNSIRETWHTAKKEARIVHILAKLRDYVLVGRRPVDENLRWIAAQWRGYYDAHKDEMERVRRSFARRSGSGGG